MTGDRLTLDDLARWREQDARRRQQDRRRARALAGLGALLAVGLAFLFLHVLTTWPDAIAAAVHTLTGGSS